MHLSLVKDKHSWVIAPAFYNQPTNIGGGVGFGENNLFGQNQKLLLYGQIATGDSFFIGAWVDPVDRRHAVLRAVRHVPQAARASSSTRRRRSYLDNPEPVRAVAASTTSTAACSSASSCSAASKLDARLRGAKVSYSETAVGQARRGRRRRSGGRRPRSGIADGDPVPAPGERGLGRLDRGSLTIDRRANWYGITQGHRYAPDVRAALPALGSDFDYCYASFALRARAKLLERHNLILEVAGRLRPGPAVPAGVPGRRHPLRGWKNDQFRGDVRVRQRRVLGPAVHHQGPRVRGLAFCDSGYTTFLTHESTSATTCPTPTAMSRTRSRRSRTRSASAPGSTAADRAAPLGLDFGYGLEAVTSRSIWRSALLTSLRGGHPRVAMRGARRSAPGAGRHARRDGLLSCGPPDRD